MLVDVSHVVEHGMITYKGLPAPLVCDFLSREQSRSHYAPGTEFHIGKIDMVANTGTYLDSPFHRYATGMLADEKLAKKVYLMTMFGFGSYRLAAAYFSDQHPNREVVRMRGIFERTTGLATLLLLIVANACVGQPQPTPVVTT